MRRKVFKNELYSRHLISFSILFCCWCFSAGIGRTGVLITMETAMCLIECNQPVYPLDIVRTMRDQRAMMIQTPVSIIPAVLCCRTIIFYDLVTLDGFLIYLFIILQRSPLRSVAVALAPGKNKFLRLLERSNSLNFYRENLKKNQQLFEGYLANNDKKGQFSAV